ncbi:hypothetical protein [Thalassococcus sp. BH17M4-6]|uniref:hypothetical protein n=1 Tax=Thalassococcus sp. BH17M4-6 TaxID=3413148 RepID=UPI003BF48CFC
MEFIVFSLNEIFEPTHVGKWHRLRSAIRKRYGEGTEELVAEFQQRAEKVRDACILTQFLAWARS